MSVCPDASNVSVIVQGPVVTKRTDGGLPWTVRCLASIRRHLPKAEVVLSTWKGEPVDGLDCDQLVLNDDPGSIADAVRQDCPWPDWRVKPNNVPRQIVSTREGLRVCRGEYALKLRTDFVVTAN